MTYKPTKEEYIAGVKYELCIQLGLKDGEGCGDHLNCVNEDPCPKCGRRNGNLVKPEYYDKL